MMIDDSMMISHPGYFGKVGMRYYHKVPNRFFKPTVNLDRYALQRAVVVRTALWSCAGLIRRVVRVQSLVIG
jgi:hypothetical protein